MTDTALTILTVLSIAAMTAGLVLAFAGIEWGLLLNNAGLTLCLGIVVAYLFVDGRP